MINTIKNIISSSALYNTTQNTVMQVTTETCLKAVGRPAFILMDKQIDNQTKKYSATKEFLYQLICLGIYLAAITPLCKKGAYALAKKIYPNESVFKAFKNPTEFMNFYKLKEAEKIKVLQKKSNDIFRFSRKNIDVKSENLAKGAIEAGSLFASVSGFAVLAPMISHIVIKPVMKLMESKDTNSNTISVKS